MKSLIIHIEIRLIVLMYVSLLKSLFIEGSHHEFLKITCYQFILMYKSCFKK